MSPSGLFEVSEVLTVTPAVFKINRIKREKLRCSKCYGDVKTAHLCLARLSEHSSKSAAGKAMSYFLKNYESFTRFISLAEVPIDNNPQERQLRSPVVGRQSTYSPELGSLSLAASFANRKLNN
jgi:hypothetical protein